MSPVLSWKLSNKQQTNNIVNKGQKRPSWNQCISVESHRISRRSWEKNYVFSCKFVFIFQISQKPIPQTWQHCNGLAQDHGDFTASALELPQSSAKTLKWYIWWCTVGTPYNTNVGVQKMPDRAIWKPVVAKRNNTNPWSCSKPQILVTRDSRQVQSSPHPAIGLE